MKTRRAALPLLLFVIQNNPGYREKKFILLTNLQSK
jgi:hypothetical protein